MAKRSDAKGEAKSTKEKAAAARAAQQSAEKRRERTIRIAGAIGVIVVVVLIIGLAVIVPRLSGDSTAGRDLPAPNPSAALPQGVFGPDSEYPYGVPYGAMDPSSPVLQLWEDFQCPACGSVEALNGAGIKELGTSGQVQLIYRPATFLDVSLRNTSSAEATSAWGCAIDQGKTAEYQQIIYANQPQGEGTGWTLEQLIAFGSEAGIEGAEFDAFTQCVNDGTYLGWAVNSNAEFSASGVGGTPTGILNGQQITGAVLADQAELQRVVDAASNGGANSDESAE
jgi:protein-disulfide isomerase